MNYKTSFLFIIFGCAVLFPGIVKSQISAPGKSGSDITRYPVFNETDSIYVFCTGAEGENLAVLRGNTNLIGTKTFLWEKYNPASASFEFYFSESSDEQSSEINGLEDGGYRLTISQAENTIVERAWVFNNWYNAEATIPESNCEWFSLNGEYTTAELKYYDLVNNAEVIVNKNTAVQWKVGEEVVSELLSPQIFNPPTSNTNYNLRVYDKFLCQNTSTVTYNSIVTKADFSIDKQEGEAPLIVTFTNTSENGISGAYEWFFFRDLDDIKRESEGSAGPVDSIEVVVFDDSPVYTYEFSGTYMVKLVSKNSNCTDTVYLQDYIIADTSFIAVPNVFTPNGDGTNDLFVVKFWSMQSVKIDIFNRWGKRVHHWESGDVRGFEGTWTESVWDGRGMGGRFASPGVYYWVVEGTGRDGEKRHTKGFVHLFRDKE
jgi:gliding motility-associated-like protein